MIPANPELPVEQIPLQTHRSGLPEAHHRTRLLQAHHPATGDDSCPRCRTWWGRRRRWPCQVWREESHRSLSIARKTTTLESTPVGRKGQSRSALSWYHTPFPGGVL